MFCVYSKCEKLTYLPWGNVLIFTPLALNSFISYDITDSNPLFPYQKLHWGSLSC